MVLKAHLLLEEALHEFICSKCSNPDYVAKANLGFHRKLQLARALCPKPTDDKRSQTEDMFWEAAEALNTLRNQLAHNLEPKSIPDLLKRMHVVHSPTALSLSDPRIIDGLGLTISVLVGFAWGLATREGSL
jgi:hypothetical protein